MEPITIDLKRVDNHTLECLTEGIPSVLEEAAEDLESLKRTRKKMRKVTLAEAKIWHDLLGELATGIRAGGLLILRTPTACCAFTTLASEAQDESDPEGLLEFLDAFTDDRVLPDCVAPLCAYADYDEWDAPDGGEDNARWDCYCYAEDSTKLRPLIRHPFRTWSVTVTLEVEIDRSLHPCDPDVCPLEVLMCKRVTFKSILARTEHQAEHHALDLFETTHKVMEGGCYGAKASLIGGHIPSAVLPLDPQGSSGHRAAHQWYERHSTPWVCVCGSTHEDSP